MMSTTDEQRLREALTACRRELLEVLVSVNDEKVHFDGDDFHEALRLAANALTPRLEIPPRAALAQQAPTPAVLPEPVVREAEAPAGHFYEFDSAFGVHQSFSSNARNGNRCSRSVAYWLTPTLHAVSEPAAPVDARTSFEAWAKRCALNLSMHKDAWGRDCYRYPFIDAMWTAWDAALTRQAAAPAEGEK